MDSPQHVSMSLRPDSQRPLYSNNESVSAPLHSTLHDGVGSYTEDTTSYFPHTHTQWGSGQMGTRWQTFQDPDPHYERSYISEQVSYPIPRSEQSFISEQVPYSHEAWTAALHRRRPSTSTGLTTSSDWCPSPIVPDEQRRPMKLYAIPKLTQRSSSQPGRGSDRWQEAERPAMLRQNSETSPMQHQVWTEPAFRGNADYQLFAEATFGLSPDYQQPNHASSTDYFGQAATSEATDGETLRSIDAFRQLAQLPQTPDELPTFRVTPYFPRQWDLEMESRPNYFSGSRSFQTFTADTEDDELPNYAQSQAEMLSRTRQQAVRRAQELQRRWRESHP